MRLFDPCFTSFSLRKSEDWQFLLFQFFRFALKFKVSMELWCCSIGKYHSAHFQYEQRESIREYAYQFWGPGQNSDNIASPPGEKSCVVFWWVYAEWTRLESIPLGEAYLARLPSLAEGEGRRRGGGGARDGKGKRHATTSALAGAA